MLNMPRPRPPHLQSEMTRHGARVWYVRIGRGSRVRIRGDYGSPEFVEAYNAAVSGHKPEKPAQSAGSLAWLIDRYRDSSAWSRLARATKKQRDNIFHHVVAKAGEMPLEALSRAIVRQGIDDRKETPFAANNFLKTMRGLCRWAFESGMISEDPTSGIRGHVPRTDGFHVWTEDEIHLFEQKWIIGTRERLAFAILLYTGLRRGDASRLGRQHLRNNVLFLRTEKTGREVVIPILPELASIIEATPTGSLAFIATKDGRPMSKFGFGNWFREACKAAGVPGAAHGLRKAGATRAANNGATEAQLEAIFGWSGGKMASLYTRKANRERLAAQAMVKLSKGET